VKPTLINGRPHSRHRLTRSPEEIRPPRLPHTNFKELPYAKEYPSFFPSSHEQKESSRYSRNQQPHPPLILRPSRSPQACHLYFLTRTQRRPRVPRLPLSLLRNYLLLLRNAKFDFFTEPVEKYVNTTQNASRTPSPAPEESLHSKTRQHDSETRPEYPARARRVT
jgi:hypothetical protein